MCRCVLKNHKYDLEIIFDNYRALNHKTYKRILDLISCDLYLFLSQKAKELQCLDSWPVQRNKNTCVARVEKKKEKKRSCMSVLHELSSGYIDKCSYGNTEILFNRDDEKGEQIKKK